MATLKKRVSFFDSEEGTQTRTILEGMIVDTKFNTGDSYSANAVEYPDNVIPFVDKHMNYLNAHPSVDLSHYISNLRLITRVR